MRLLRADALLRLGRREEAFLEATEVRRRLAAPAEAYFGYERAVSGFDAVDQEQLARIESALRRR